MISNFPAGFNFNRLFLKLNRFSLIIVSNFNKNPCMHGMMNYVYSYQLSK